MLDGESQEDGGHDGQDLYMPGEQRATGPKREEGSVPLLGSSRHRPNETGEF